MRRAAVLLGALAWIGCAGQARGEPPVAPTARTAGPTTAAPAAPPRRPSASIVAEMSGFERDAGLALVALFTGEAGFPDGKHGAQRRIGRIRGGRARVVFDRLPPGTYAIAVLHDVDGDKQMDTNFFGAPTEGYGASNNARRRFGPPEWNKARFTLAAGQRVVQKIRINN